MAQQQPLTTADLPKDNPYCTCPSFPKCVRNKNKTTKEEFYRNSESTPENPRYTYLCRPSDMRPGETPHQCWKRLQEEKKGNFTQTSLNVQTAPLTEVLKTVDLTVKKNDYAPKSPPHDPKPWNSPNTAKRNAPEPNQDNFPIWFSLIEKNQHDILGYWARSFQVQEKSVDELKKLTQTVKNNTDGNFELVQKLHDFTMDLRKNNDLLEKLLVTNDRLLSQSKFIEQKLDSQGELMIKAVNSFEHLQNWTKALDKNTRALDLFTEAEIEKMPAAKKKRLSTKKEDVQFISDIIKD